MTILNWVLLYFLVAVPTSILIGTVVHRMSRDDE